jgi:predicted nucleic acid-binding protein
MLRLFVDANIIISAAVCRGPECRLLEAAGRGAFVAVTTRYVQGEARRALASKFGLSSRDAEEAVRVPGLEVAEEPDPSAVARAAEHLRDRNDAPVLAGAWAAQVDALVTGDKGFHTLKSSAGVWVLRAPDALKLLEDQEP